MLYATNTCQYHVLSYSTLVYVLCLHLKSVKRKEMAPYRYHHPWNKTCCCNTCQKWADKQILSHIPLAEEQGEEGVKQWKRLDSCLPTTYVSSTSSAPLAFRSTWHWHTRLVFHQWQHVPDSNATLLPQFHNEQAKNVTHMLVDKLLDGKKQVPAVEVYDGLLVWYYSMLTRTRSSCIHSVTTTTCFDHHGNLFMHQYTRHCPSSTLTGDLYYDAPKCHQKQEGTLTLDKAWWLAMWMTQALQHDVQSE